MRGQRPLSISQASSYSPLSSNSFASLQHSSARPPTSRFGFTNSRKSEDRNVIVRTTVPHVGTPNCACTVAQFSCTCKKKFHVSRRDARNFVSFPELQNSEKVSGGYKIVSKLR